jgi:hypothetical protein
MTDEQFKEIRNHLRFTIAILAGRAWCSDQYCLGPSWRGDPAMTEIVLKGVVNN